MNSIGETLRRERLKRNLELGEISQELKISSRMLAAIEEEKFDKLPGGVFARSFVRQYARYLGLDEEDIAGRVGHLLNPVAEGPHYHEVSKAIAAPIQVPPVDNWAAVGGGRSLSWKSPLTALGLVVVAMLGCAGVYAWWLRARRPAVAHEPPAIQSVHAMAPHAPPASAAPEDKTEAPATATATAAAVPASSTPEVPQAEVNPNAPVRVQLTAAEPVWVSVKSDGKYLFSGVLEANQSRTVDANTTVLLLVGNAGGVTILLNGKPIGTVGPKGQVRNVQLTSGGFEIVAPVPKAPVSM